MAKLSKAQQQVLEEAMAEIDHARSCDTFEEFYKSEEISKHIVWYLREDEKRFKESKEYNIWLSAYNERRNAIVLTHCNSKTLEKLSDYGLIEIIKDSKGKTYGIDTIKVLNY